MSSSVLRKTLHLKADSEKDSADTSVTSLIDISRSGLHILKRNQAFKAFEFISFETPFAETDQTWAGHVEELIHSENFQQTVKNSETVFYISDSKVALVPASLHTEQSKISNLEFLFGEMNGMQVLEQRFSNVDAVGVFAVPKALLEVISKPVTSAYLSWIDSLPTDVTKSRAHLVIQEKQFVLVILKDGALLFSNWFRYEKADDVLYYLMASLEALKILHADMEVVLGGTVSKGDEIYSTLARFISKLSFAKRPKNLSYSYSFSEVPEHRFPLIFNAACA